MKKQCFYPAIYADSIKQIRMLGIVLLVLCLIITLLSIFLAYENVFMDVDDVAPVLGIYMFIGPLLLTFSGFSFLFRRNASDFFHALPATRLGLANSIGAAILTWVWGTVIVTLLVAYGCMAIRAWPINWAHLPYQLMGYGFGSLLVMACCMIGVSLTGTRFSAFIVSGLILFLPRFISFMCGLLLQAKAPLLIVSSGEILLNVNMNFPVGYFVNLFGGGFLYSAGMMYGGTPALFYNGPTHIYTAILAVVYVVLAIVAFRLRASETAEKSAPSRILQHVYRSLITLPLMLALSTVIMTADDITDTPWFTVLIVITLLVYFLYELITTKRFKNLLTALYTLPIVVVFSFGISWGTIAYGNAQMAILPQASNIESVQMYLNYEGATYQALRVSEVVFTDSEFREIISKNLADCYDQYRRGVYRRSTDHETVLATIRLKNGGSIHRMFQIQPVDKTRYLEIRDNNADYRHALNSLPEDDEVLRVAMEGVNLSDAQLQEIWLKHKEEMLALSDEEREQHILEGSTGINYGMYDGVPLENGLYEGKATPLISLMVWGSRQSKNFQYNGLFTSYTPQTSNLAMRYCNQDAAAKIEEARQMLDDEEVTISMDAQVMRMEANGKSYASAWMYFYGGENMAHREGETYTKEQLRDAIDMLLKLDISNPDIGKSLVQYQLHLNYLDAEGHYKNLSVGRIFAPVTNAQAQMLLSLSGIKAGEPEKNMETAI